MDQAEQMGYAIDDPPATEGTFPNTRALPLAPYLPESDYQTSHPPGLNIYAGPGYYALPTSTGPAATSVTSNEYPPMRHLQEMERTHNASAWSLNPLAPVYERVQNTGTQDMNAYGYGIQEGPNILHSGSNGQDMFPLGSQPQHSPSGAIPVTVNQPNRKRKRASNPCERCRRLHQPCTEQIPRCSNCELADEQCMYAARKERGPVKGAHSLVEKIMGYISSKSPALEKQIQEYLAKKDPTGVSPLRHIKAQEKGQDWLDAFRGSPVAHMFAPDPQP
ncbi:Uu.00g000650.m01.CDS01 [Anthostomella pinea]|uniref:Uu.00g000650.m01.CDS01 n=1 Tax=Anthostomella pinea TaxID=933095 RepID=A0AAI8VK72_9PEZI|nr:Uu.00g000650.m01.CDS01 [Anthostomella pinea]